MDLNNDLLTQFAKVTTFNTKDKDTTTVRGTIYIVEGRNYIRLDGADTSSLTPVETTVELNDGDRVIAVIKDHNIIITGNETNPSVGTATEGELRSTIEQTAGSITTRVEFLEGANTQFSQFQQTVNGFSFMGNGGEVKINGGDLNLTGSITWSDLSSGAKSNINSVASSAASSAIPSYIKTTKIDGASIESSTIIGGTFHAVGSDPNKKSTFTTMNEDGLHLYSYATVADANGVVYPKISLFCENDRYATPAIIFGSGIPDDSEYHNRFIIAKETDETVLEYMIDDGDSPRIVLGLNGRLTLHGSPIMLDNLVINGNRLDFDGDVYVGGNLRGDTGLFPIGYVYISYEGISPASYFGGTWESLPSAMLWTTTSYEYLGTTACTIRIDMKEETPGNERANFVRVAAWRRVG